MLAKTNANSDTKSDMTEDPLSSKTAQSSPSNSEDNNKKNGQANGSGLLDFLKFFNKPKNGTDNLREALEEYIGEISDNDENPLIAQHEQGLISNILKLRDLTVVDVMIPRADIVALDVDTSQEGLLSLLSEKQYSRLPVYTGSLDNVIGTLHIKDVLSHLAADKSFQIKPLIRPVPIVSPSMHVLDLMLEMRQSKKHMVMVVDEYGGIDGLATIGDILESIVGELHDEFDMYENPQIIDKNDGVLIADARVDIQEFEDQYGAFLTDEQRNDIDTLGGLVFYFAGRVPARGEVLKHESGLVFEILDADPRRINRLRIKNLSALKSKDAVN